jgi:BirA family transcriptional regulator, biotin operon repressor / biotin---[acetyl-CoA-carboxylase] ligase
LIIGTQIVVLDEVSSTNDYIRKNIDELKDGAVVISRIQSSGRGRNTKKWISSYEGNLYASVLIKDQAWLEVPTHLPIICAVVLRDSIIKTLGNELNELLLKWPNDIYYKDAKLSGILIESSGNNLILGLGLNIVDAPKLADKKTACLAQIIGPKKAPLPQEILSIFIELFNKAVGLYKRDGFKYFITEWEKYCRHLNKKVCINEGLEDNTPLKAALFLGLAKDGGARLKVDGEVAERVVYYGEISIGVLNG